MHYDLWGNSDGYRSGLDGISHRCYVTSTYEMMGGEPSAMDCERPESKWGRVIGGGVCGWGAVSKCLVGAWEYNKSLIGIKLNK